MSMVTLSDEFTVVEAMQYLNLSKLSQQSISHNIHCFQLSQWPRSTVFSHMTCSRTCCFFRNHIMAKERQFCAFTVQLGEVKKEANRAVSWLYWGHRSRSPADPSRSARGGVGQVNVGWEAFTLATVTTSSFLSSDILNSLRLIVTNVLITGIVRGKCNAKY